MKAIFLIFALFVFTAIEQISLQSFASPNSGALVVTTTDSIKGQWQRKEDALHVWSINADGTYSQVFNGETQVKGKWGIYTDTKENSGKADANGAFLWLTADDGSVYCYKVEELSAASLKLKTQSIQYEFVKG